MLLEQISQPVTTHGVMRTAEATIKANRKVFNMFADDIYSNKPLAICRELVSNAVDSHTGAGVHDVPVEVWLPTDFDPMFRVRDRGVGMSEDFVFSNYLVYADGSTKDGSNEQIGGFGIGKASVFSYVDQFTLRSVHNGTLSIYTVYTSEEGIPTVGLLSQSPTSEANGVEVNFPVEQDDFAKFHKAAQQGLQFFNPLPVVYGGELTAPEYVNRGDGWAMREKYGDLNVIMGGVCYPVATNSLNYEVRYNSDIESLFNFGLDIEMPIGACGVSLSRESLSYDTRTSIAIRDALLGLVDDITASFATMFDSYSTLWEAAEALNHEVRDTYSGRGQFLRERAIYKGNQLETFIKAPAGMWTLEPPVRQHRSGKTLQKLTVKWDYGAQLAFQPGSYEVVIIDDLPEGPKSKVVARVKHYAQEVLERDIRSVVIRPRGDDTIADLIKALGDIPRSLYILTSELEVPAVEARAKYAAGERPRVRMFSYDGHYDSHYSWKTDRNNINPSKTGVQEIAYDYQPDDGVLVITQNFNLPEDLRKMVTTGLLNWSDLRFVNSGDAPKLNSDAWIAYDVLFQQRLAEVLSEAPELPQRLALSQNQDLRDVFSLVRSLGEVTLTAAQQSRPFGKIYDLCQKYIAPLTNDQIRVAGFVAAELPAKLDPVKLVESFKTKQPRAARLAALNQNHITQDREFFLELI